MQWGTCIFGTNITYQFRNIINIYNNPDEKLIVTSSIFPCAPHPHPSVNVRVPIYDYNLPFHSPLMTSVVMYRSMSSNPSSLSRKFGILC